MSIYLNAFSSLISEYVASSDVDLIVVRKPIKIVSFDGVSATDPMCF